MKIQILTLALVVTSMLTGCTTPNYAKRDSTSQRISDSTIKYGSIAAASGLAYAATSKTTDSKGAAVGAGVIAGGLMYSFNNYGEKKAARAYDNGVEDGANSVRAEILNEKWRREAVLGVKDEQVGSMRNPDIRRVYVPSREINGVKYDGNYQSVPIYR
jgi:hypothetical protein